MVLRAQLERAGQLTSDRLFTEMVKRTRIIDMTTQNMCKRKCNG